MISVKDLLKDSNKAVDPIFSSKKIDNFLIEIFSDVVYRKICYKAPSERPYATIIVGRSEGFIQFLYIRKDMNNKLVYDYRNFSWDGLIYVLLSCIYTEFEKMDKMASGVLGGVTKQIKEAKEKIDELETVFDKLYYVKEQYDWLKEERDERKAEQNLYVVQ